MLSALDSVFEILMSSACHPDIDHGYNISRILHPAGRYNKDRGRGVIIILSSYPSF